MSPIIILDPNPLTGTSLREPLYLAATPTYWPRGVECILDYNNSACVLNDIRRADQIVVTAIGGLGGPDLNAGAEKNPGRDGESPQDATYAGRTITIRGYVKSGSVDGMRKLFSYVLDGFDVVDEAPLWMRWLDWRDPFVDSNALVDYAYDAGTGTLAIASDGSGLQPTSTANKQLRLLPLKSDGTTPTRFTYGEGEAVVKFKAGTALTGLAVGVELRRSSSAVKLRVIYEKATDTIRVYKINTGTTQLASIAATGLSVGTSYWLRVRAEGSLITFSLWSSYPPDTGGTALFSGTHTLSGGDLAIFPASASGQGWGLYWTPNSTTDRVGLLDVGALNPGDAIINCRKSVPIDPGEETQAGFEWRRDFMITLRASDSRMVSRKVTKATLTPPSTPASQLYYSTSLTNLGRSPADMSVRFNAGAVDLWNPRVLLPAIDRILGVDALLSTTDPDHVSYTALEVDTGGESVVDQSGLSRYSTLSNDTTWPELQRGANELRIVADRVDDFLSADGSGGFFLNGRVASNLGTFATSGAATDFEFSDAVDYLGESATSARRTTTADTGQGRIALVNTSFTSVTDATVGIAFQITAFPATIHSSASRLEFGPVARYVDANNFLRLAVKNETITGMEVEVIIRVAGSDLSGGSLPLGVYSFGDSRIQNNTWYIATLTFRTNGRYAMSLIDASTGAILNTSDSSYGGPGAIDTATTYPLQSSHLATAGALQTGKVGFFDKNASGSASTRYYNKFYVTSAINAGTIDVTYRHSSR